MAARREELADSRLSCSTAIGFASTAQGAPAPSDKPRRRRAVRRAERRPKRSAELSRLKWLEPEQYLDLSLKDAVALESDRVSKGGENKRWMESSNRGFSARETLALSFFGAETRIRDIHPADREDFVLALGSIPKNWGKSAELSLPTSDLILLANDKEEQQLLEAERLAEAENWSNDLFKQKCDEVPRLSPAMQYKHQSYLPPC